MLQFLLCNCLKLSLSVSGEEERRREGTVVEKIAFNGRYANEEKGSRDYQGFLNTTFSRLSYAFYLMKSSAIFTEKIRVINNNTHSIYITI